MTKKFKFLIHEPDFMLTLFGWNLSTLKLFKAFVADRRKKLKLKIKKKKKKNLKLQLITHY